MGSVLQKGAVRCVGILHPSLQCLSAWHLLLGCGNTLTNRRMMHGPCARFVCLFCTAVFLFHFQLCKEANKKEFFLKFCGSTSAMASHLKSQHNVVQYGPKGLTAINEGFSPPPPPGQKPITAFTARTMVAQSAGQKLSARENCCVLWALNALPYQLIQDPLFRAQFGPCIPPGLDRHVLSNEMKELAQKLDDLMYKDMSKCCVTLGIDGWTNTRHRYKPPTSCCALTTSFIP